MPLYVTLSNKPIKIEISRIAYVLPGILVLKPIVDKLSITYQAEPKAVKAIIQALVDGNGGNLNLSPIFKEKTKYGYGAKIVLSGKGIAVIQAGLKDKPSSVRLEFNPSEIGTLGISYLNKLINNLSNKAFDLIDMAGYGKVTRLDVAVDIIGCSFRDLLFEFSGNGKSQWHFAEDGMPETIYFGKTKVKGPSSTSAYNKRQELKDHGSDQKYGGVAHGRVERRMFPQRAFITLDNLKNPFLEIAPFPIRIPAPKNVPDYVWRLFLETMRVRGRGYALSLMPEFMRHDLEDAINHAEKDFWRPSTLWQHWPEQLARTGLGLDTWPT